MNYRSNQLSREELEAWEQEVAVRLKNEGLPGSDMKAGTYKRDPGIETALREEGVLVEWSYGYPPVVEGSLNSAQLREKLEALGFSVEQYPEPGDHTAAGRVLVTGFPGKSPW